MRLKGSQGWRRDQDQDLDQEHKTMTDWRVMQKEEERAEGGEFRTGAPRRRTVSLRIPSVKLEMLLKRLQKQMAQCTDPYTEPYTDPYTDPYLTYSGLWRRRRTFIDRGMHHPLWRAARRRGVERSRRRESVYGPVYGSVYGPISDPLCTPRGGDA